MHFVESLSAALLVGSAFAASTPSRLVLHDKREFVPMEWTKRSVAPRDLILPVRIAITPKNTHLGHDLLMDVSDPSSANFGKHWTPKEIEEFFSPDHETVETVQDWLSESGIHADRHDVHPGRGHIQFGATVDEVEALFGTQYEIFEHEETGDMTVSCEEYHVPEHIKDHIDFVTPSTGFDTRHTPSLKKRDLQDNSGIRLPPIRVPEEWSPENAESLANCSKLITPACLRALYGIPKEGKNVPGNDLGIYEEYDTYDQKSLNLFFAKYSPNVPQGTHPILQSIDGGKAPTTTAQGGGESALDFELAYPIVYPQPIKLYQTLDLFQAARTFGIFNPFLDALDASYCTYKGGDDPNIDPKFPNPHYNHPEMCGKYKPTNVISISYALSEHYYPKAYEVRQCHEYMKLGLQGTSLIFASGDNGTVARAGKYGCLKGGTYNPNFPATCPYVTTVGATQLKKGAEVTDPEKAVYVGGAIQFTSGGGFANNFARPSYQNAAVKEFLQSEGLPPQRLYNASGRGFPDVAANGWPIATFVAGKKFKNGGTSASAPIFASIITRINGERLKAGKGPLGFLNPAIYSNPQAFNDITEGFNLGCHLKKAFKAVKGWDPVTGMGTPIYDKLLKAFMALP